MPAEPVAPQPSTGSKSGPDGDGLADVVAIGAHPDDVEIGCGGTVALLARQGYRVAILDLTDGEPTPASPGPEVRLAEARRAADLLGASERVTLTLPNRRLFDTFDARVALGKELRRLRPRLVIGLGGRTPMASPDHEEARKLIDAGVFYSRLSKWDEHFPGLPVHRVEAQLYYSLRFYSLEPPPDGNEFVVDISSTLEAKMASIDAYKTQFPPEKRSIFGRVESMARALGGAAGFEAGESLSSPRVLGTSDVMGMAGLGSSGPGGG
ncbi:MAG: PIG-L family deacetylase [Planctomycetota bacterium]